MTPPPQVLHFADLSIDPASRLLLRAGTPIPLTPKVFDTLLHLVQNPNRVLSKQELLQVLWPDAAVEENNLNQNISTLRRLLGDTRGENRFIATVPGIGYRFTAPVRAIAPAQPIRIAVLPFENLGADPERDYLADGLTEETIASLGQIDPTHLSVIGRTSVMRFKRTTLSLSQIASELEASHLLESSLRAERDRLRITSRLIRVSDQLPIWTASWDSEPVSLLNFQRELSIAIAEQVRLRLSPTHLTALAERHSRNAEAYDLYLRGRFFFNQFNAPATQRAVEYFTRATTLDPGYALAWSGLADAFASSPVSGDTAPARLLDRAREAATNAVRSDPTLAEAQTSLGFFSFWLGWDWALSESAFRKAIATDPNYAFAHRMLGILLSHCGRSAEALASIERARELDPLNPMNRALSSQIAFAARDLPSAIQFGREAILLDPEFWIGHFQLAQALAEAGDPEALEALNRAARFSNSNSKTLALRGYLHALAGQPAEALEILHTLERVAAKPAVQPPAVQPPAVQPHGSPQGEKPQATPVARYIPPYAMALIHAGLSQASAAPGAGHHASLAHASLAHASLAIDWLDRAYSVHDVHLAFLTVDPKWDTFRRHPRFVALLERCPFYSSVLSSPPPAVPGQGRLAPSDLHTEAFQHRA